MRRSLMTKPKPKKKKTRKQITASDTSVSEFDAWAVEKRNNRNSNCCVTCSDPAFAETIRCLLQAMIRKKAHKILIRDIFETAQEKHPSSDVGLRSLERHLRTCERTLYFRARGRKNVDSTRKRS